METSARYVLIGSVTLMAILAGLGFVLWLGKIQIDRTYARYDIVFDSVEGLGAASPVRFNGVDVGKVLTINLNRANPSQVRVSIEVAAETPIRQGTVATLQSQGVTGVSFVGLEGGRADAELLPRDPFTGVPLIPSESSVVQGLIEDAPDLLEEAISLLKNLRSFASDENQQSVTSILKNVDVTTARLDAALTDFAEITDNVAKATGQIAEFTARLDSVADKADTALETANNALAGVNSFVASALPQVTDVSTASKRLIETIARLAARIDRDPARFFLGNRTPEYN